MGQQVSRVLGAVIKRPLQRYNVEHRAAKVISKIEDPTAPAMRAPMYKSDRDLLEAIRESNPHLLDAAKNKDMEFTTRLKDVYVTSTDPAVQEQSAHGQDSSRPLPADRTQHSYDFIPGSKRGEPNKKPPLGRLSLSDAVDLLTSHAERPAQRTATALAEQYRLNAELTEATLKHFRIFKMMEPEKRIIETRDPLVAGKDWVEDVKLLAQPGSGLDFAKAQTEEMARLLKLEEKRSKEQKLLEDSRPRTR